MSFLLTLDSNVDSFKVFGTENKISEFKTKLARPQNLVGDWVVGVCCIWYPKTWYNILNPHKISLFDELGKVYSQNKIDTNEFTISEGYYETPLRLVNEINKCLGKFTTIKPPKLVYNELNNFVTIEAGLIEKNIKIYPDFGDEIENILGLKNRSLRNSVYSVQESAIADVVFKGGDIYRQNHIKAFHPVEIKAGYHALFLYTDIVYPSLVGDSYAQLLRVLEVPRKYKQGEDISLIYEKPLYYPVMIKNFETIEISIKDDTNTLVPFTSGRVIIVLHFKKL